MSHVQHALPAEQDTMDVLVLGENLLNGLSDDRHSIQPPNPGGSAVLDFRSSSALRDDLRNELKAFSVESMRPQLQDMVKLVRAHFQEMVKLIRDDLELLRTEVVSNVHPRRDQLVSISCDPQACNSDHCSMDADSVLRSLGLEELPHEKRSRVANGVESFIKSLAEQVSNDCVQSCSDMVDGKLLEFMQQVEERPLRSRPRASLKSVSSESDIDYKLKDKRTPAGGQGLFSGRAFRGNMATNVMRDFHSTVGVEKVRRSQTCKLTRQSEKPLDKNGELADREVFQMQRSQTHLALLDLEDGGKEHPTSIVPQYMDDREDVPQTPPYDSRPVQHTKTAPADVVRNKSKQAMTARFQGRVTDFIGSSGGAWAKAQMADGHESIRATQESVGSIDRRRHHRKTQRDNVFLGKAIAQGSMEDIIDTESESGSMIRTNITFFVNSLYFDAITASLIALNAVWIGVQTDIVARHREGHADPGYFQVIDLFFCILFSSELALRMYVHRCSFFYSKGWQWNFFDMVLVAAQISEEILARFAVSTDTSQYSFMRVLRILRLIRVVRLVRIVRMIGELRTLVTSIISSLKSLSWTVVLLSGMMYVVGIYFTQLVSDHGRDDEILRVYFGSLGRSLLSLFEAFTGGVDWDTLASPLLTSVHPLSAVVFALYIAFAVLAVLNVVTGVFVESALAVTRHDKDVDLVNHLREVFTKTDTNNNGMLDWEEFESFLEHPSMEVLFKAVDLDRSEARGLFELIDVENNGEISREEFIMGCMRLKGGAKALDLATLMYDNKRLANMLEEHMNIVEDFISKKTAQVSNN